MFGYVCVVVSDTTIICQIESREALEDLEAIAATPGVDVLWIGHFDLTQSLDIPGQFDHPLFHNALQRVVEQGVVSSLATWLRLRSGWQSASM